MAGISSDLGAKLGPRVAQLMAGASTAAFRARMPVEHALRVNSTRTIVDWMGLEFGQVMSPFADKVLKRTDIDPDVRRVLKNMTSGANQWQALAGIAWGASGVTSMLGTIMNNYLADLTYQTVGKEPRIIPDVSLVTQLFARGWISEGDWAYGMSGQGIGQPWADAMLGAAKTLPDVATVLTMLNRGMIGETTAEEYLVRGGYTNEDAFKLIATAKQPLSVPDAALAVLRGSIDLGRAQQAAADAGVSNEDLQVIIDNTGEPPAVDELLLLWRRGQIDDATLERGIRQSRLRDEWIPQVKQLGVMPPSPAEVIDSLVTGQTDQATAQTRWREAGGDPTWFTTAWHTGGEAPTPNELAVLANRGLIPWTGTGPDVVSYEQGFKESRFKDKYLPYFRKLSVYLPPPRTVTALLNSGAIDKTEATKLLLEQGLDAALVAAYVDDSHRAKTAKQRELAVSEIELLYQERAISADDATGMLTGLGYDAADAAFILATADLQRLRKYTDAVITALHSKYTHHLIDRSTASSDLDKLGIASDQRDQLLALWDIEASATVKRLTETQVVSAAKKEILTGEEALAMLMDQGYPQVDATILLLEGGIRVQFTGVGGTPPRAPGGPVGVPGSPAGG